MAAHRLAAEVEQVARACAEADGVDPLDEAAHLALAHPPSGLQVHTGPGGFALLLDGELTLAVAPDRRREGVAADLLADLLAGDGKPARRAWSHADHPGAARLAGQHGWRRARELWVMRRDSAVPLPDVDHFEGIDIATYTDDDAEELLAVNAAAFAHHPEQGDLDAAGLAERVAEPWFDPSGLILARDAHDRSLLGFHWTKRHSASLGEVYVLGIAPAAQGRGLGRLLTVLGLRHLIDGGATEVLLYVEGDNTAARHTYARLDFTHADRDTHVQYLTGHGADADTIRA